MILNIGKMQRLAERGAAGRLRLAIGRAPATEILPARCLWTIDGMLTNRDIKSWKRDRPVLSAILLQPADATCPTGLPAVSDIPHRR